MGGTISVDLTEQTGQKAGWGALFQPTASSIGTWIAVVVAVLCMIGLFVFVFLNRGKSNYTGCSVSEINGNITTQAEHDAANSAGKQVIVVHHSDNCGYCKKFKPVVSSVASDMGMRVVFSEVSSSEANSAAFRQLGVSGVPAYTVGSTLVGVGYMDAPSLQQKLSAHFA